MQENSWSAMLRRIPAAYHDGLILSTVNGTDLVLQAILRAEKDVLIMRGRTAGSSDGGKIMVVPYQQITYISFSKRLTDPEVQSIFGAIDASFAVSPAVAAAGEGAGLSQDHLPPAEDPNAAAPAAAGPGKAMLLAKLRARLNSEAKRPGS